MALQQLDLLDYNILRMLSGNARKPYLEIARECNVSGAAIHQRMQKLTAMNVLVGSQATIDPSAVGFDTCAYVGFYLNDSSQLDALLKRLEVIPEVVECHITSGHYDVLVKIVAKNNDNLLSIVHEKIQDVGVRSETLISFKEVFRRPIPVVYPENK